MEIIDLDECVINALELFCKKTVKKIKVSFKRPLVVGSGNGAVTGKILFENAMHADESTYKKKKGYDGVVLISASGKKHAPIIAKTLTDVILFTNNPNAPAAEFTKQTHVFPKNTEPYSYNTSTYMGMILSKTGEDTKEILKFVKKIKIPDLKRYNAFFIIIPEEFEALRGMLYTKFDELFGPMVNGRIFTPEQAKHAKTIIPSDREMFISFGYDNKLFGKHRFNINLPKDMDYAGLMATTYYMIGHIQKQKPPYFKRNIRRYVLEASKIFGHKISPITT